MKIDMTKGNPMKIILLFSIPVLMGNLFQQFYNMVDTVIVGQYLGSKALAAVGSTGCIMFLVLGFANGIAQGFGVMASHAFGAKKEKLLKHYVALAIILTVIVSVVLTIPTVLASRQLLIWLNTPDDILKPKMTKVAKILSDELQILAHDSAWAYVKGRDVITAMKEHQKNNSRWFLKLDLKDFFGSCSVDFIVQQLEKIYPFAVYPSTMPRIIANFATLNGGLPQGTPLSPMLTNLIMIEIDYKINRLIYDLTQEAGLFKQHYVYTRYADDIIISAKNNFKYDIIIEAIDNLLEDTPLTINREKVRYGSSSGRNWNLGIMYNKDNELTIGYREKQKLKVTIYNYIHDGLWPLEDLRWLLGKLNWLHNVQPDYFEGLMNYYKNKYNVDVIKNIISDIKTYNN